MATNMLNVPYTRNYTAPSLHEVQDLIYPYTRATIVPDYRGICVAIRDLRHKVHLLLISIIAGRLYLLLSGKSDAKVICYVTSCITMMEF